MVFVDGALEPSLFSVTAGDGNDFSDISYLAIGGSSASQNWALDLDFVGYKTGVEFPPGAFPKPFLTSFGGSLTGFRMDLSDGLGASAAKVDLASISVAFDGQAISPAISRKDKVTIINYTPPAALASASKHTVKATFADTGAPPEIQSAERTFTVEKCIAIAANTALDETKLNRSKRGFTLRPYGTEEYTTHSLAWTEDALAGVHGENTANLTGADANGLYAVEDVINFDLDTGAGNFTDATGRGDKPFPGFPGLQSRDSGTGNAIEEVLTLLEFPKTGTYIMGVNSDDGFRVSTAGPDPRPPARALVLGQFDGGRPAIDTIFSFYVEAPGVYAFRLIWLNGAGRANLEWFTVESDGRKVLVNDPAISSAIKAYQFQLLPLKPAITKPSIGITITREAGEVKITFTGSLQTAKTITGPWTDVSLASSPFSFPPFGAQRFYRSKP